MIRFPRKHRVEGAPCTNCFSLYKLTSIVTGVLSISISENCRKRYSSVIQHGANAQVSSIKERWRGERRGGGGVGET